MVYLHALLLAAMAAPCAPLDGPTAPPWATTLVDYALINPNPGFEDPAKALGPPSGGSMAAPNNQGVVSLGTAGSFITLGFDAPIENRAHPEHFLGLDFIVFSNAFWVGGDPQNKFIEAAMVEVGVDETGDGQPDAWYVVPGSREFGRATLENGIPNPDPPLAGAVVNPNSQDGDPDTDAIEFNWGYADMTPTQQEYLDNFMRPDDPFEVGLTSRSGGGDAFDISWAIDDDGQPANLDRIHFVRVTSFLTGTMGPAGAITSEVDAVMAVARTVDSDGDGIYDDYETRVAGTDPCRPENTVLPLEIPALEGGSPPGTLLGRAERADGAALALYADAQRTGQRNFNCVVDIAPMPPPNGDPPSGLLPSAAAYAFTSSEPDFLAAQVQTAELTMPFTPGQIAGIYANTLTPYRWSGSEYTQAGIENVVLNIAASQVVFRSQYPGDFVLLGEAAAAPPDAPAPPVSIHAVDHRPAAPGPVTLRTGLLADVNGNPTPDGVTLTLALTNGWPASADADPAAPGHQVLVNGGRATFLVWVDDFADPAPLTARLYADPAQTSLLGEASFAFAVLDAAALPLGSAAVGLAALAVLAVFAGTRRVRDARG